MFAQCLLRNAAFGLVAVLLATSSVAFASEDEPFEYQASVNIQELLEAVKPEREAGRLDSNGHFADATNGENVRVGVKIYKEQCSSCHGRQLQGQALWQVQDEFFGRRAPAHDATGHSWQHSDEELFRKVSNGHMSDYAKDNPEHRTHAFRNILSEAKILQVLAFIKARWPLGIRVAQSTLNPDFAGMPADADQVEWTFPPDCLNSR